MEASSLGFSTGFNSHPWGSGTLRRSSVCEGKKADFIPLEETKLKDESVQWRLASGPAGNPRSAAAAVAGLSVFLFYR